MRRSDLHHRPITWHLLTAVAAITVVTTGCAWNPAPVPVFASRADWETLTGRWSGSYTTAAGNRRGLIDFTLSATDEQAFGDVLMIAEGRRTPYQRYPPGDSRVTHIDASYTQLLTIKFVRAEEGRISGSIDSYWDPDHKCQASATFVGMAQARAIEGTFSSACEDGVRQIRGTWRVTRQRASSR